MDPRLPLLEGLWAWLSQAWCGWRESVHIVRADTVIAWRLA